MQFTEKYNGVVLPRLTPERWEQLKHFPLRSDDVFIATYPKCGTTWVQQMVKLLRNGGQGDSVKLDRSIPWLEILESDMGKILRYTSDMATSPDVLSPRAFKSHFPYEFVPGGLPHTTSAKYIYVMRNPKDACVSLWHHRKMSGDSVPWDQHLSDTLSEKCLYGTWFDHVLGWWKHKYAPNILFIKYEDIVSDPRAAVQSVAEFIGIEEITEELLCNVIQNSSFANMKEDPTCNYSWLVGQDKPFSKEEKFFRKGKVGNWKEYFSPDENKRFDELFQEKLGDTGLTFRFE